MEGRSLRFFFICMFLEVTDISVCWVEMLLECHCGCNKRGVAGWNGAPFLLQDNVVCVCVC